MLNLLQYCFCFTFWLFDHEACGILGFPGGASGKESTCWCRRCKKTRVQSLGWEDPQEEGMATHSSILVQGNPMDRGAWWAIVHGVTKSWTRLSNWGHACGILAPWPGIKPTAPALESRVLTSGPPGESLETLLNWVTWISWFLVFLSCHFHQTVFITFAIYCLYI